jgi:hypothetical protein
MDKEKQVLENDFIKYTIEDDLLFAEYKVPTVVDLDSAKEMIEMRHRISDYRKQYWCVDFTNLKSFTKEGRDYADVHGQDYLYATAVIVNSHLKGFILNTFLKLKKSKVPLQAFKSKVDAVAWLTELKKEHNESIAV